MTLSVHVHHLTGLSRAETKDVFCVLLLDGNIIGQTDVCQPSTEGVYTFDEEIKETVESSTCSELHLRVCVAATDQPIAQGEFSLDMLLSCSGTETPVSLSSSWWVFCFFFAGVRFCRWSVFIFVEFGVEIKPRNLWLK